MTSNTFVSDSKILLLFRNNLVYSCLLVYKLLYINYFKSLTPNIFLYNLETSGFEQKRKTCKMLILTYFLSQLKAKGLK